jgi:hypothetical protein
MIRKPQVARNTKIAGRPVSRTLGATEILCAISDTEYHPGPTGGQPEVTRTIAEIPFPVSATYQRIFVSATVSKFEFELPT